jgi:quercetin dioxygenase-like cupin family protein
METITAKPRMISSKQGDKYIIMGHGVTVKVHSGDGNNNFVFELTTPPGAGIPPHIHTNEDEVLYVLQGEFEVMIGGDVFKATMGDCLNFVRNIPHAYTNTGTADAKTLWYVSPGRSFENFFAELSQYPPGPPDREKFNALCGKYGMTFLV